MTRKKKLDEKETVEQNESLTPSTNSKVVAENTSENNCDNETPVRKSHRISEQQKKAHTQQQATPHGFSGTPTQTNKSTNGGSTAQVQTQQVALKPIRKILVWNENDTRWFFEALCEYGKDFPHIQSYIATRYEKKGIAADLIKNYENVRHYYYRMWHKVSQMLKLPSDVERVVLETYGLINYGELWKRVGSKLDVKLIGNLQQLVLYGFTAFKVKGKMFRVRTPVCNALKRIHNIQVPKPPAHQIPKEIVVELMPATNRDWIHVQKLSQNPRLRTKLSTQHRLATLIEHLEKRWCREDNLTTAMKSLYCDHLEDTDIDIEPSFQIRLRPKNAEKICTNIYLKATSNLVTNCRTTPQSHLDLSLMAFLNKHKPAEDPKEKTSAALTASTEAKTKDKSSTASEPSITCNSSQKVQQEARDAEKKVENRAQKTSDTYSGGDLPPIRMFRILDELNTNENNKTTTNNEEAQEDDEEVIIEEGRIFDIEPNDLFEAVSLLEPPENMTLVQWLDSDNLQEDAGGGGVGLGPPEEETPHEENKPSNIEPTVKGRKRTTSTSGATDVEFTNLETAKRGWTRTEADSLSIGELFLLVGCPQVIQLEYCWIQVKIPEGEMKIDGGDDMEIFDKLAFCVNAMLASFKKPVGSSLLAEPNKAKACRPAASKETKKPPREAKKAQPKVKTKEPEESSKHKPAAGDNNNQELTTIIERIEPNKKTPSPKKSKKKRASPATSSEMPPPASTSRLSSSGIRVQSVSEDKVKEALAGLYSSSNNIFKRHRTSPGRISQQTTPIKDKPVEFVVSLGPSFIQNNGQGTFLVQPSDDSISANQKIPVKFLPAQLDQNAMSSFSVATHFANQQSSSTNEPLVVASSSNSGWLNEFHNESSMGSLLAACDIITSQEEANKTQITLTENSVDLISQFVDLASPMRPSGSNSRN